MRRLYSRTGDDMSGAFPDLVDAMDFDGALDGELLVGEPAEATGTFSDLQQRLNRKTVSPKMREQFPAFMRCYDLLHDRRARICAPCPSPSGARGSKPSSRRSTRRASTCRRWSPSPTGRRSTSCARARRIRSSKA